MEATKKGVSVMIAIALIPLVMVLGNSMLVPVLPTMESQLGISQFQSSLIITVFSFAAGVIIPLVGYLSDRYGRKMIIVPSLIVYGLGSIVSGLAAWLMENSYTMIIVGRVIQGIGAAGTAYIAMALVGDLYSGGQESKALGALESTNGLGKILSPIIGALVAIIAWYAAFFVFPVICFAVAVYVWFGVPEKKKPKGKPLGPYLQALKQVFASQGKWLIPAFFVGATGLFILFGVLFYLSDVLEETHQIDGILKGTILAIPLSGMVITAYITGAQIKQNKPLIRKLMLIGLVLLTGSMAAVAFFEQLYVMIGLLTLGSVGTGLALPCLNTLITAAVDKSERGMITSLYGSVRFLGVAFGPPIFGWLMKISHQVLFFSVTGLSLVTLVLAYFFIKPGVKGKGNTEQKGKARDQGQITETLFRKREKAPT
ncbi:MFS transporter [Aneurinibacillus tyrosinisolvens]|uniref:MFS transporter n=1 Tax=Aneurinibacillus tyrosinisolvens TaxID=1443435 RepID=UPI0009E4DFB0|nr:MFS transporter [Aneurinibacillus tyrosinisolvens]